MPMGEPLATLAVFPQGELYTLMLLKRSSKPETFARDIGVEDTFISNLFECEQIPSIASDVSATSLDANRYIAFEFDHVPH